MASVKLDVFGVTDLEHEDCRIAEDVQSR